MIALALALIAPALAADAARPHTAQTLRAGEGVVRWPLARSAWGITDATDAWATPIDLSIGGPRLGLEHGGTLGRLRWSLSPSVGLKTTLRRASLRLASTASRDLGVHQISARLSLDARLLRQLSVGEDTRSTLAHDRLQADLLAVWDSPRVRFEARLPLRDRGRSLAWGSGAVSWIHTTERTYLAAGAGLLVGRPHDQYTLGEYLWWFWLPYPKIDLALRL